MLKVVDVNECEDEHRRVPQYIGFNWECFPPRGQFQTYGFDIRHAACIICKSHFYTSRLYTQKLIFLILKVFSNDMAHLIFILKFYYFWNVRLTYIQKRHKNISALNTMRTTTAITLFKHISVFSLIGALKIYT